MSDLAARMAKQVKKGADEGTPAATEPFKKAPKKHPHRVTLDLSAEDYEALRLRAFEQHTGMATLLRALVRLYVEDPSVAKRIKTG